MDTLKGTESIFMIILSLISQIIDIPNYSELVGSPDKKKSSTSDEQGSPDNSSLVRRNVFFDITSAAKTLFQNGNETNTGDSEIIFGRPLPKEMPTKLKKLLIFLKQNVHYEGIFRKCGSNKRIKDIKKLLDSHGNVIDWSEQEEFTVHDAASVLKQYVAELPEPLLCEKHIPIHIEIAKLADGEKKLKCLQLVLLLLPEENRMFLKMLLMLLSEVALNPHSLMDYHNLGLIFAPHILKSKQMETAANMCLGNSTMSDPLDDLVTYTAYLINNSDTLFKVPRDLEQTASKYQARLQRGESCEEIPVEIASNCVKMSGDLHKDVVYSQTKQHLLELYKAFQQMPEGKDKNSRLKKFEKEYPHYIMELNNVSHSPMIRTKSTRRNIGNSISKLLHVKTSSTPKATASPSVSSITTSITNSFSFHKNPLAGLAKTPCKTSTPLNSTQLDSTLLHSTQLHSTPILNTCTPLKSDVTVNVGQKRKVLEMLQSSPPRYTLSSFIDPVAMETEAEPRVVRRRLEDQLCEGSPSRPGHEDKAMTGDGCESGSEDDVRMDYRDIGTSYREYFV